MDFLQRHAILASVAGASGLALLATSLGRGLGGRQTSPAEAVQLINRAGALVLDVREAAEYAQGHLIGARNIPLGELAGRCKELERFREKPVLVVCQGGTRAGRASSLLSGQGFTGVSVLAGGVGAWQQAGMPVERSRPVGGA